MIAGAVRAAERLQIVAEFDEIETGNGADALELRPQLASALSCFLSKGNSFSCMFVRPLRVGTNNVICSCFSARQYPWPGSSRVLLPKKGTYPGAAGGVERTRLVEAPPFRLTTPASPAPWPPASGATGRRSAERRGSGDRAWPRRSAVCRASPRALAAHQGSIGGRDNEAAAWRAFAVSFDPAR
jgi:hypothetical protein